MSRSNMLLGEIIKHNRSKISQKGKFQPFLDKNSDFCHDFGHEFEHFLWHNVMLIKAGPVHFRIHVLINSEEYYDDYGENVSKG